MTPKFYESLVNYDLEVWFAAHKYSGSVLRTMIRVVFGAAHDDSEAPGARGFLR
jgi:hypothetical protein